MKLSNSIKELAIITVGNVIVAAAVFFFMLPSHVSVGSGAALAMVLSNFIPLSVSIHTQNGIYTKKRIFRTETDPEYP